MGAAACLIFFFCFIFSGTFFTISNNSFNIRKKKRENKYKYIRKKGKNFIKKKGKNKAK